MKTKIISELRKGHGFPQSRRGVAAKEQARKLFMQVKMAKAYIAIIILTLAASVVATSILFSYNAEAQKSVVSQVLVGGGNVTYPFFGYNPQEVKIRLEVV